MGGRRGGDIWPGRQTPPWKPALRQATPQEVSRWAKAGKPSKTVLKPDEEGDPALPM